MPKTLLVKNADVLVTMDAARREIRNGGLFVADNRIVAVGPTAELPQTADEVLDLTGHVVIPGLVNTHHHMFQTLTRALPAAQDAELFDWLTALFPVWQRLTPEMIKASTKTAMAELMLSGCTTAMDHLYLYPNGCRLDDEVEAAREIGMRFHASRGAMSVGVSKGGLPPDSLVEDEGAILEGHAARHRCLSRRRALFDAAHRGGAVLAVHGEPGPDARGRPARAQPRRRHAHPSRRERQGRRLHAREIRHDAGRNMPRTSAGSAATSGMPTASSSTTTASSCSAAPAPASPIARAPTCGSPPASRRSAGCGSQAVPVGLGVDGSASNDASHLLAEARQAMLLARVGFGPDAMTAREALEIATLGGAKVLNRDDIGALAPDMAADFVAFDLRTIGFAGGLHDPVAALVFCAPASVALSVINGRDRGEGRPADDGRTAVAHRDAEPPRPGACWISRHTAGGDSGNSRGSTPKRAERRRDRIGDGAADRNDAAFARAFDAERIVGRGIILRAIRRAGSG